MVITGMSLDLCNNEQAMGSTYSYSVINVHVSVESRRPGSPTTEVSTWSQRVNEMHDPLKNKVLPAVNMYLLRASSKGQCSRSSRFMYTTLEHSVIVTKRNQTRPHQQLTIKTTSADTERGRALKLGHAKPGS